MTRKLIIQISLLAIFVGCALSYLQIVSNSKHVAAVSTFLRLWSINSTGQLSRERQSVVIALARNRLETYEQSIKNQQLVDGMVVNRKASGSAVDFCDSLLFSSLRFIALKKIGYESDAKEAWQNIEKSQNQGHWYRHPACRKHTSRDMIIGVLAALTQRPQNYRFHLTNFLDFMDANKGFVSTGPFYVSLLSPSVAEIVRIMARLEGINNKALPDSIRSSFSTLELNAAVMQGDYRSHLIALQTWIELELIDQNNSIDLNERTVIKDLTSFTKPFTINTLYRQRREYVTQKLIEIDPDNLFYRYLRFRTASALTPMVAERLLTELLAMPQFPQDHLPMNCNRKVDYLWQRPSDNSLKKSDDCDITFSGVDFLWMASLLLEKLPSTALPNNLAH